MTFAPPSHLVSSCWLSAWAVCSLLASFCFDLVTLNLFPALQPFDHLSGLDSKDTLFHQSERESDLYFDFIMFTFTCPWLRVGVVIALMWFSTFIDFQTDFFNDFHNFDRIFLHCFRNEQSLLRFVGSIISLYLGRYISYNMYILIK